MRNFRPYFIFYFDSFVLIIATCMKLIFSNSRYIYIFTLYIYMHTREREGVLWSIGTILLWCLRGNYFCLIYCYADDGNFFFKYKKKPFPWFTRVLFQENFFYFLLHKIIIFCIINLENISKLHIVDSKFSKISVRSN